MCDRTPRYRSVQAGVTLVEMIVFMVIIGVGVAGLVSVSGPLSNASADPMVRKQMVSIAESILFEVTHQPFTYCDPDDANFLSATSTASCSGGAGFSQDKGGAPLTAPTPGTETRLGGALPGSQFDNVADYGGYGPVAVTDVTGGNAMAGYDVAVAVGRVGASFAGIPNDAALLVTVTVTRAGQTPISVSGYRFRYAPRN